MLESIRILGNGIDSSINDYLSIAKLKNTKLIMSILIKNHKYSGIGLSEKRDDYLQKYLYSAGAANGADKTPSSLITEPEKTFNKKFLKWFKQYHKENQELSDLYNVLLNNSENILNDIKENIENIHKDQKRNILLTIKIEDNKNDQYIGEKDYTRKILISQFENNENDISTNEENNKPSQMCIFCNEIKSILVDKSPISDIFSFSTFDKKGFLYEFSNKNIAKQLPVCLDCYKDLRKGKDWFDRYAYFNFEGYKYYIIPDIIGNIDNLKINLDLFKTEAEFFARQQEKKTVLKYENYLMSQEKQLSEDLAEEELLLNLIFIFITLKGGGKYIDVEKIVEGVSPTWLKTILDNFNNVLKLDLFREESMRNIISQKWEGDFGIKKDNKGNKEIYLAAIVKEFFPIQSIDIKFLDMMAKILSNSKISSRYLFSAFMRRIRSEHYKNWNYTKIITLKSLILFLILKKLKLLTNGNKNDIIEMQENSIIGSITYKEILDDPSKKAVFLEGALVGKLLAIQYASKKSTPFIEKLHGLNICFSEAKSLLPKIINKLREYQVVYSEIEKDLAHQFLISDRSKKILSNDESSYYFTLGMLLHNTITRTSQNKDDNIQKNTIVS